ncbi:hypothetical protein CHLNCDRAFT_57533 [Chlorella variabilis]|uniref:Arsenosugar biosynthesis radical SAM protein ArsS-like C-terminal domain-containing protein n=1 Tax=Chlorella variabilis TaxID=554065 RepID=E1ZBG1_CHLVA|nr:hypothetical protein CHLNCDRAFT_57533 [Chlorella variabilis]EFN56641.1 hypothetical protein CHLNCDRAFT_57533 [Chlorella variabilis]|eukprot:XP_005848743.1 hypothetical protein CHLNCDRAFT_57533 [Chlorella variabilis]
MSASSTVVGRPRAARIAPKPPCSVVAAAAAAAASAVTCRRPTIAFAAGRPRRRNAAVVAAGAGSPSAPTEPAFTSLIPETLEELDSDEELQQLHARIQQEGQAALTREEQQRRQRSLDRLGVAPFGQVLKASGVSPLVRRPTAVFQLNIGLYCNQACRHCHVESSPKRTEMMSQEVAERCVHLMERAAAAASSSSSSSGTGSSGKLIVDLTGGAPELTPQFRQGYLVREARRLGHEVIDRCNLTVLLEPGQEDLAAFLADHSVRVVASLPCYSAENVDSQRGGGVFRRSIAGLQALNAVGYGQPGSGLSLDLVYNPGGVFLAPPQAKLEPVYKQELADNFGITFNSLLCLNNMPIKRWADHLVKEGKLEEYMALLVDSFNPAAAEGVMCRDTISVGWDGRLYDCDFNQQLELGLTTPGLRTVFDVESLEELTGQRIAVDSHCFGCTAGAGSSCQGATS